jgi:aminomethyltransferase
MLSDTATELKRTPLYYRQNESGARLVDFHGWKLPLYFESILKEHDAVRNACGIFDVSHMGRLIVEGPGALELLQKTNANDVSSLSPGHALYSHMLNERGGVIDDLIIARLGKDRYSVVVNASRLKEDKNWIIKNNDAGVAIQDETSQTAMIAVQGPHAEKTLTALGFKEAAKLPRFGAVESSLFGQRALISRTGYTGEDGFEVIIPNEIAPRLWDSLLSNHALACGLGARDTLRLEAGLLLYGQDMNEEITSLESSCSWLVKLDKGDFIGKAALLNQKQKGLAQRIYGLKLLEKGVPRPGSEIFHDGRHLGFFSSATFSPTLKTGIGFAYLPPATKTGDRLFASIHGRMIQAEVVKMQFFQGKIHA